MENKFNFKPMQWVLGRWRNKGSQWTLCQFSHINDQGFYIMCGGECYPDCIPYKGNKHLLGTTDDYVETYEPKDGDFISFIGSGRLGERCLWIAIFKYFGKVSLFNYVELSSSSQVVYIQNARGYGDDFQNVRPATEEEKQLLLSKLHESGKDWDAEKKAIIDYKWKPERGDSIFVPAIIECEITPAEDVWYDNSPIRLSYCEKGWVFKTKEECQTLCDKLNKAISEVK